MAITRNQTIEWFIRTVLLGDLRKMIYDAKLHYLGFGNVACAIEFLGACLDSEDFNKEGLSKKRFEGAIEKLFIPIDNRYKLYNDKNSPYYLYKHLRCGMAHIMRPQGMIAYTTRDESKEEGTEHLEIDPSIKKLILVSEDFYDHLELACKELKNKLSLPNSHKKLSDLYLSITDFE